MNKKLVGIKAVGFDVDGTLYHIPTEMALVISREVIEKAAAELGRDTDDFAEEYLKEREKYRGNTLTLNSFGLDGQQIFQKIVDDFPVEKYVKQDKKLVSMIRELKKKYQVFIITNGTGRQVERKLKLIGLDYKDFDPRIYCYDQGWVKPDPAPFLAAIESLKVKPDEVVYVGDRIDLDVEGAKAVGMKSVFVGGESAAAEASIETVYDTLTIL